MSVRIVYFAWVRERIGKGSEEIELPDTVITVGDLIAHLATLGEEYAAAFEVPQVIRAAINEEHAEHDEAIGDAREIALFPPMTGRLKWRRAARSPEIRQHRYPCASRPAISTFPPRSTR
jgi:molybdopterin synthase sulfur carrier subunit